MAESVIEVDVMLPAASNARAAIVTSPRNLFAFSLNECGADVSVFISFPLTQNSTLATPMLSLAWAETMTTPLTVVPLAGDTILTVGGTLSGAVTM